MKTTKTSLRGRQALMIWVWTTVLLFGVFAVVRVGAGRNLDEQIDAAQRRSVGHAAAIGRGMESRSGSIFPAFNQRELTTLVQAEIFDDPTVARVRLYGVDGVLLFATDQDVRRGSIQAPSEDPGVAAAASGSSYRSIVSTAFTRSTVGAEGADTELLQTFEPLKDPDRIEPIGVVEADFFMEALDAAAVGEVDGVLTMIALAALASLGVAVALFRRRAGSSGSSQDDAEIEQPQLGLVEEAADVDASPAPRAIEEDEGHVVEPATVDEDGELPLEPLAEDDLDAELAAMTSGSADGADEQLAQADPESPEALDLRARLAKTAARKKLSSSDDQA
jgi:hypothetical protein